VGATHETDADPSFESQSQRLLKITEREIFIKGVASRSRIFGLRPHWMVDDLKKAICDKTRALPDIFIVLVSVMLLKEEDVV
jgi:hypothetical protein